MLNVDPITHNTDDGVSRMSVITAIKIKNYPLLPLSEFLISNNGVGRMSGCNCAKLTFTFSGWQD